MQSPIPKRNIRLRPSISLIRPARRAKIFTVTTYAVAIKPKSTAFAPMSTPILGKATFTAEIIKGMKNIDTQHTSMALRGFVLRLGKVFSWVILCASS